MLRYLRLYGYFLRFSFSRAMEFRVDFFFRVVMDAVFYATHLAFFGILYRHTDFMGGWNVDQILIFVTGYFLVDAIQMTVISNNMWYLPFLINKGDLDYYLVRPVSPLFFVSLREFAANSFLNLLIACGLLTWALARYPEPLEPTAIVAFLVLLVVGTFLYWIIQMFCLVVTFWTHYAEGLRQLFFGLTQIAERPDQIFRGWVRRTLVSILPFALIVSYPTHLLFEGITAQRVVHILVVVTALFSLLLWVWSKGLRSYASASS